MREEPGESLELALILVSLLISIIAADRLIQTYVRSRARQLMCKGVAGLALFLQALALFLIALSRLSDVESEVSSIDTAIVKAAFLLQHIVTFTLAISGAMYLGFVRLPLGLTIVLILLGLLDSVMLARAEVDLSQIGSSGFAEAINDSLAVTLGLLLLLAGAFFTVVFQLGALKEGGFSFKEELPHLAVIIGVIILTISVLLEDFGSVSMLSVAAVKTVAIIFLALGLINIKPLPKPLC